ALAEIFLKRALSLVLLVGLAFGLYLNVAAPMMTDRGNDHPVAVGLLLGLWVVTALAYPWLRSGVTWFVDVVVLRRTDYEALRAKIAQRIALLETPEQALDETCARVAEVWRAREVPGAAANHKNDGANDRGRGALSAQLWPNLLLPPNQPLPSRLLKESPPRETTILAPTAEPPQYYLTIGEMAGGRRLMSDDVAFLEAVAVVGGGGGGAPGGLPERRARGPRGPEGAERGGA